MKKIATLTLLLVAGLPIMGAFALPQKAEAAIASADIVRLVNNERTKQGLNNLNANSALASAAQAKANDMAAKGYFAHQSPTGEMSWDLINKESYEYVHVGENLALGYTSAEAAVAGWMNSPGHRSNILSSKFEDTGIGMAKGMYEGRETIFLVQIFGTAATKSVPTPAPVVEAPKPVPAPAPVEQVPQSVIVTTLAKSPVVKKEEPKIITKEVELKVPKEDVLEVEIPTQVLETFSSKEANNAFSNVLVFVLSAKAALYLKLGRRRV